MENEDTGTIQENERLRIQDTKAFKNVLNISVYDFVDDTYYGCNGYRDGSYLIPHPREVFYNTRRQNSSYKNYFRSIIKAMVDPVFNQTIQRDDLPDDYKVFVDNCDSAGTSLNNMIKKAVSMSRRAGVSFVVMDMPKDVPLIMSDAISQRKLPYIYTRKPQDVFDKELDIYGKIKSISFYDCEQSDDKGKYKTVRKWDSKSWYLYKVGENKTLTEIENGDHNLGIVPVIPVLDFCETQSLEVMPDPPLYELARLNFQIFNLESEIRMLEQNQSFSIFYMQGVDAKSVVIGVNNFILIPPDATIPPGFASPDPTHLVNLVNNSEKLRDSLYLIAQRNGVIGVTDQSGVAKEWDFRAEESVLKDTAAAAKSLEMKIAELYGKYTKRPLDYEPVYPSEFSPSYSKERMNTVLSAIDKMPPKDVERELWKEFTIQFWKTNEDVKNEIIAAIDASKNDEFNSGKEGNIVPPEPVAA